MASNELTVSAEQVVHSAMADTLQKLWDDYGICVKDLTAEWTEYSSVGGHNTYELRSTSMTTMAPVRRG